jgi:hypothetical protein
LQIIGDVVAEFCASKRSMRGRRQFMVANATLLLRMGNLPALLPNGRHWEAYFSMKCQRNVNDVLLLT